MELTIGGIKSTSLNERSERFTAILWGPAKSGKTTLASTAPGPILYLMFDPDGAASLKRNDADCVIDLSKAPDSVVSKFVDPNSSDMKAIENLAKNNEFTTLVLDSLTSLGNKALVHGIALSQATKQGATSNIMFPGLVGYGAKNIIVNRTVANLLAITQRHNKNFITIGHEDAGKTNDKGDVIKQTLMLGSSLVVEIPKDMSEVWYMQDVNGKHEVLLRPRYPLSPMGSRMFDTRVKSSFFWKYDPITGEGTGIKHWLDLWAINEYNKIPIPV